MVVSLLTLFIFTLNVHAQNSTSHNGEAVGLTTAVTAAVSAPTAISPDEQKKVMKDFNRVLQETKKKWDQTEKADWKKFKTEQKQSRDQWRKKERTERRMYFDAHLSGPERRTYVQAYIQRKKEFEIQEQEALKKFRQQWIQRQSSAKKLFKSEELRLKQSLPVGQKLESGQWFQLPQPEDLKE
jgi:hypothetical protein